MNFMPYDKADGTSEITNFDPSATDCASLGELVRFMAVEQPVLSYDAYYELGEEEDDWFEGPFEEIQPINPLIAHDRVLVELEDAPEILQAVKDCGFALCDARKSIRLLTQYPQILHGPRLLVMTKLIQGLSKASMMQELWWYKQSVYKHPLTLQIANTFRIMSPLEREDGIEFDCMATLARHHCFLWHLHERDGRRRLMQTAGVKAIECMDACIVIEEASDENKGKMLLVKGCFLLTKGDKQAGMELLKRALEVNESENHVAHHFLGTIYLLDIHQGSIEDAHEYCLSCIHHYKRFLDLALEGDRYSHRAAVTLSSLLVFQHVPEGTKSLDSATLESIVSEHPDFPAEAFRYYKIGVKAAEFNEACYGLDAGPFRLQYKKAASLMASLYTLGYISEVPPAAFICAWKDCDRYYGGVALSFCSKCQSIKYCSRKCQKEDWKYGGHKEECPRLKALRESKGTTGI
ncbi:hypothetical protein MPSEU_000361100 [Mayamaea pseudoterrestris]|nr:hypothetical protein MPSEU_000361100 [Mayamaea pseudoterrestris]